MIDLGLSGKRAVVSGAGYIPERAGHGWFTSLALAEAGASVACIDIDEERAERIAGEIAGRGGNAVPIVADMTDPVQVGRAIDDAVAALGGVDVCVDIIGGATWSKVEDFTTQVWDATIQYNLNQVFYLFQAAAKYMIAQRSGGSLVALTSVDGIAAATYHAAYGAAKAGVISLVKTFADELGRYGIRANAVAPGNVGSGNEDQPPNEYAVNGINPLAAPRAHDIANAALFLSSELAARITGQTLVVDGGATIRQLWGLPAPSIPPNPDDAMPELHETRAVGRLALVHHWQAGHRASPLEHIRGQDRADVDIAHVLPAPGDTGRPAQHRTVGVIEHHRRPAIRADRHDPVGQNECHPEVSIGIERAAVGHPPPATHLRVGQEPAVVGAELVGAPAAQRRAESLLGAECFAPDRKPHHVSGHRADHIQVILIAIQRHAIREAHRIGDHLRRLAIRCDPKDEPVGGAARDGIDKIVCHRAHRTPQRTNGIHQDEVQPPQRASIELSAQHRRDRAGHRVEVLQHTRAEVGDQKVAVAVERDPVRLAARLPHTPNGVLINEFCDS